MTDVNVQHDWKATGPLPQLLRGVVLHRGTVGPRLSTKLGAQGPRPKSGSTAIYCWAFVNYLLICKLGELDESIGEFPPGSHHSFVAPTSSLI